MNHQLLVFLRLLVIVLLLVVTNTHSISAFSSYPRTQNSVEYSWVTVASPTSQSLHSIAFTSPTDGWAVGVGGTILHWDGGAWTTATSPVTHTLDAISMNSTSNAWIAGYFCGGDGNDVSEKLRYNGNAWTLFSSETASACFGTHYWSVSTPDPTNTWMAGGSCRFIIYVVNCDAVIARWNGQTWQIVYLAYQQYLSSVYMVSSTLGWAVGYEIVGPAPDWPKMILQWNGNSWTKVESSVVLSATGVIAISGSSSYDVWAVGRTALHWDGSTWTEHSPLLQGDNYLHSVSSLAANNAWAVGTGGAILHWDGNVWSAGDSPTTSELRDIKMISPHEGWAVGEDGTILHYGPLSTLAINYPDGQAGSFFTLTGSNYFPPGSPTGIIVNNHLLTDTLMTADTGDLVGILDTSEADNGRYFVTTTADPRASASFTLDPNSPLRPQDGSGPVIKIPNGIAFTHDAFLPLVYR